MKPKYLVRPSDFSIFDLDETNGINKIYELGTLKYSRVNHRDRLYLYVIGRELQKYIKIIKALKQEKK
jgi:hypothetical protein